MAETERFEKQSFDFLHLFLCYSVLFSSLSRFLSTYSTYSSGCFYRDCCHVAVSPSGFPLGLLTFIPVRIPRHPHPCFCAFVCATYFCRLLFVYFPFQAALYQ